MVNYFEKMDGKGNSSVHSLVRRSISSQDGRTPEHSRALVSVPQSKETMSGAATPRSLTVMTTQKCQSLSDIELSPRSASMAGSSLNKDLVMAKLNKDKVLLLIKAWEENKKKKSFNRFSKKMAKLEAWELGKKARAEARLRTSEERLENDRAACIEKARNKVALVQKIAEEKRALAEAHHGKQVLKAEETAAKCRASGARPRGFFWC
ncbi:hypothetical protein GOP47_0020082 [Adiantum capillus-veneris]|uniref:Remorin C-terminal domain-containing protein n=1 Tax=Adiantum capillus-veneris TaxID=13818 RepID=A0A9D4UCS3_ADICA|nr:hypothetical protein GOP47_0020082 [Adiantum capillus-veneris]